MAGLSRDMTDRLRTAFQAMLDEVKREVPDVSVESRLSGVVAFARATIDKQLTALAQRSSLGAVDLAEIREEMELFLKELIETAKAAEQRRE